MRNIVYVVVILALIGGWIAQQAPIATSQTLPVLPTFKLEDVAQFELVQQGKVLIQARYEHQKWLLLQAAEPAYLKAAVVEQLLRDLQTMSPKRVASNKAEHHGRFDVSDSDVSVLLSDHHGKELLHLFVGKPATDLRSTYVRLATEDTVVTVDKILTWQVKRTKDAWLAEEKEAE